jgi:hypothetical protein
LPDTQADFDSPISHWPVLPDGRSSEHRKHCQAYVSNHILAPGPT